MGLLTGDVFWSNAAERCSALKSVAKKYLIEDYSGFNEYCGEDDFLVLASGVDSEYDNPEAEEREYIRFISNMKYVDAESDPRFDVTAPVIYRILTPEQRLKVNEIIEEFKSEHGEYHDYTALMKNDEGFDYDGFTDDELIVFNESVDSLYLSIYDQE
ncbi:MAG: hypothetical protein MJ234_04815, partial [bacterium]|nr:hypothetical protein [bacterium]